MKTPFVIKVPFLKMWVGIFSISWKFWQPPIGSKPYATMRGFECGVCFGENRFDVWTEEH